MFDTVECPYCEHENDMSNALCDGLSSDNTLDWTCRGCEEEFEVHVEFEPSYSASKIVYVNCEKCGTETRDPAKRGCIFPWPQFIEQNILCRPCYRKSHQEEYDKR